MADDVGDLKIRPLSPEMLEQAKKNIGEDPKRRAADVQHIREWLKKQPHIIGTPSDQLIVTFLRGCKFSLEKTKQKLDMYFTMKTLLPEFFKNRDLKNNALLREIFELGTFAMLPNLDDQGRPILIMKGGREEPGKYNLEDLLKINFLVTDYILMTNDALVVNGSLAIMDMAEMKLAHATQFSPSYMKKMSVCSEEGYPFRPKGMHFINTHPFMDTMFKVFQSFNKEKLNRRTFVHGKNVEAMFEQVPKRLLPKDYGGDAPSFDELSAEFRKKVLEFNDWFLEDEKNGVDEKKRVGRAKTQQELFGMEGSFRQLSVD